MASLIKSIVGEGNGSSMDPNATKSNSNSIAKRGRGRPPKRRRITRKETNEYGKDVSCDHFASNAADNAQDGTTGPTLQNTGTDNQQNIVFAQPIDEPVWIGCFKIANMVFQSLAAHRSIKACEKSMASLIFLQPVVEVTKLPRSEVWPKKWNVSGPSDDDIALFFFPRNMSPNEELDQLVKEVMEDEAVLKVILVGDMELLIFPSIVLPEKFHMFQKKHYLWGVFKRKNDQSNKIRMRNQALQDGAAVQENVQEEHQDVVDADTQHGGEASGQEVTTKAQTTHSKNQQPNEWCCPAEEGSFKGVIAVFGNDIMGETAPSQDAPDRPQVLDLNIALKVLEEEHQPKQLDLNVEPNELDDIVHQFAQLSLGNRHGEPHWFAQPQALHHVSEAAPCWEFDLNLDPEEYKEVQQQQDQKQLLDLNVDPEEQEEPSIK